MTTYDVFMGEEPTAEDQERFEAEMVKIAAERTAERTRTAKRAACSRCRGTGHISQYHYNEGGRCFSCN
jgi:hypothetical protein